MAKGAEFLAPVQKLASHAFHKDTIEFLKSELESWEPHLEYEFPCPHRRMKSYFVEEGVTWTSVHEDYEDSWSTLADEEKTTVSKMQYSKMQNSHQITFSNSMMARFACSIWSIHPQRKQSRLCCAIILLQQQLH